MESIELNIAFAFDCNNCGRESFVRSVVSDLDSQTILEMQDEHGVQPWETFGMWHSAPTTVTCKHCGTKYETGFSH